MTQQAYFTPIIVLSVCSSPSIYELEHCSLLLGGNCGRQGAKVQTNAPHFPKYFVLLLCLLCLVYFLLNQSSGICFLKTRLNKSNRYVRFSLDLKFSSKSTHIKRENWFKLTNNGKSTIMQTIE